MATSRKKVIVRRFLPGLVRGYLLPAGFVARTGDPALELLDLSGRVLTVPLAEVKMVSFVRDFNLADETSPERLSRKLFLARPRNEGLWLRLTLRDGDEMEGLAPTDLSLADGLTEDLGFQMTPPDIRGNTQRFYVPRTAITSLQVVAAITTPSRKRTPEPEDASMPSLFAGEELSGGPVIRMAPR